MRAIAAFCVPTNYHEGIDRTRDQQKSDYRIQKIAHPENRVPATKRKAPGLEIREIWGVRLVDRALLLCIFQGQLHPRMSRRCDRLLQAGAEQFGCM